MIHKDKKGFTLIETVLYVGIIGMTIGAFISFILMISGLRNKYHVIEEVQSNKRIIQEVCYHYVRNARSVSVPGKQSSDERLDFIPRESALQHSFFEQDGRLMLNNGVVSTPITSNDVAVSDLKVVNLSATSSPDIIQLSGTIRGVSSSSADYIYEDNFRYNVSLPK